MRRRVAAGVSLVLFVAAAVVAAVEVVRDFPRALVAVALLVAGGVSAWQAVRRRGRARHALLGSVALLLVAAIVVVGSPGSGWVSASSPSRSSS